jgi:flagellar biosynthesis/type III secretory pathway M-ring protein FliF/YscJ
VVQSALGIEKGDDASRKDDIVLEELPFNDQFATEVTQQLDKQQRTDWWMGIVKTALYPLLAIAFILVFLRMFKRTPVDEIPIGIPLSQMNGRNGHANGNGNGNGHSHALGQWQKETETGVVTVDVLNQLIKENPQNMTQAIRDWLTRGKEVRK